MCLSFLTPTAVPLIPSFLLPEQFFSAPDLQIQLTTVLGEIKEPQGHCDHRLSKALWCSSVVTCA